MIVLAVFKSRSQTLDFSMRLKSAGVPAANVNTPKEAGVGCGISVRIDARFLPRAKSVLKQKPYSSFAGFLGEGRGGYYYLN